MDLLLLSNSTLHGHGYLDHAAGEIASFLEGIDRIAFVPFALQDHQGYGATVASRLEPLGIRVTTLSCDGTDAGRVSEAPALFVGGGNTFRLLHRLQELDLVELIHRRVAGGMRYMGSSAGTVISAPTMKTTNDMPIVQPRTLEALGLIRFQINPHYLDPDPASTHMGETRETRLREFHEENATPVLGLREGSWVRVSGERVSLGGDRPARLFRRGADPEELPAGSDLSFLNRD